MTDAEIVRAGLEAVDDSPDWNAVRLGFAALDRLEAENTALREQVERYREALEFYAAKLFDRGEIARAALSEPKGELDG